MRVLSLSSRVYCRMLTLNISFRTKCLGRFSKIIAPTSTSRYSYELHGRETNSNRRKLRKNV